MKHSINRLLKHGFPVCFATTILACHKAEDLKTPVIETQAITADNFVMYVTKDKPPADNYTYAEITIITQDLPPDYRALTATTDKGSFSNGASSYTRQLSVADTTRLYLRYNKAEIARVTASINNSSQRESFVNFLPAWPDLILIDPSVDTLPRRLSATAAIKATLTRSTGTVSDGQTIMFYDSTAATGTSAGIFVNTTPVTGGQASTQYWLQDTAYKGIVYIKGYVLTDIGKVVGVNRILVQ